MKFILDAQLPVFLCNWLSEKGHHSIHTSFLPRKNQSEDFEILEVSQKEDRILISKDSDFYESFLVNKRPKRLLLITTGNIKNKDLKTLFENNLERIVKLFERHMLIELNKDEVIVHH